jgi:hypothetical protein
VQRSYIKSCKLLVAGRDHEQACAFIIEELDLVGIEVTAVPEKSTEPAGVIRRAVQVKAYTHRGRLFGVLDLENIAEFGIYISFMYDAVNGTDFLESI